MRLYLFEHCSLCFRVRMAAALKRLHLQETVVLEDDSETMIGLVGKRVIPILVRDEGQPMLESMDMVAHIDSVGAPVLTGPQRAEITAWADGVVSKTAPLTMPRYPLLGLPEFGTVAALDHYIVHKRKKLGDFVELRAKTREQIDALMPELETLDRLIESQKAVNGKLSLDDIRERPTPASLGRCGERPALSAKGQRLLRDDYEQHRIPTAAGRVRSKSYEANARSRLRR
jgi:glutaredoxin 2